MSVILGAATKRFGNHAAVDTVSATIDTGEFFVILGPSGCGKSTLLRMIAGLEPLDEGSVTLDGTRVSAPGLHVPPEARNVGVVFQSYALWPHMSVADNVAFPLECEGLSRAAARRAAADHLETVSLGAFAVRRPAELSGGQRQRVALARCLAGGARVILMDEPLANLDPHLRGRMEEELTAFHARSGATVIYITHDQREAMALATRIAVMEAGQLVQIGAPEEVHDRPANEHVARFVGQSAVLPALARGTQAQLGPVLAPLVTPAEGPVRVVIRPRDVHPGQGDIAARVAQAFYRGGAWEGLAEVPGLDEALPFRSDRRIAAGEPLTLRLGPLWALPG